ncbi:MAG TPA: glycosyltransferase [bacterium]|nr:glycosyltransferase [bacterium]
MKVSIITTVKDDAKGFLQTMQSVKMQDYSNIEYIVVDASENERLKDKCREHIEKIDVFIEGFDSSPYEGMNRGIDAATGDIIALLHAGDIYCSNSIVSQVVEKFAENDIKLVYGDIVYHSLDDVEKTVRVWKSAQIESDSAKKGVFPPHTSLFIKKELYDRVGRYDLQYEIAADSDFMFRLFSQNPKSLYLQKNVLSMRVGGRSNRSVFAILRSNIEFCIMLRKHGVSHPFLKTLKKLFSKVQQLI